MSWKMRLRFVTRFCLLVSNLKFNNNILNNGNSWKTRLVIIYYWKSEKWWKIRLVSQEISFSGINTNIILRKFLVN